LTNEDTVSVEQNEQGLWKLVIELPKFKVVVGLDVNSNVNGFPQARILSPRFFPSENVLWNGVLVGEGLTFATRSNTDPIESVLSSLANLSNPRDGSYEELPVDFKRLGDSSISECEPMKLSFNVMSGVHTDEVVLSERTRSLFLSRCSFVDREQFLELETDLGLKMVARLSGGAHDEDDEIILISETLSDNLQTESDLTIRLVTVPVAKYLRLWILDASFRMQPDAEDKVKAALQKYTTLTAGTLITFYDEEFDVLREVAILEAEAWEPRPELSLDAVKLTVLGKAKAQVLIVFSDLE